MARIEVDWKTDIPEFAEQLQYINGLNPYSSEREELEGLLHAFMAKLCFQRAERLRINEREQAKRDERRAARQAKKVAEANKRKS